MHNNNISPDNGCYSAEVEWDWWRHDIYSSGQIADKIQEVFKDFVDYCEDRAR